MRAVLQRALEARVDILNEETGALIDSREIETGLMVLLGVMDGDTPAHVRQMAKKTCEMRIFEDDQGKLNRSLLDIDGEMLVVSNFTLCADARHGRRPSFTDSAKPDVANALYERFLAAAKDAGVTKVRHGAFGADMAVSLVNDGPVTILLDTGELMKK